MSLKPENNDEDSFIILGNSPGTSLDIKCDGNENTESLQNGDVVPNGDVKIDKVQMEEALKDLSNEANMAFKAHFKLGDCPSPASMMVASTIITDDRTTEELQKQFGELLDENLILKETLKHNNDSMKEQFLLIASCQEDMLKTHMIHKEKFDETKELVERLRQENKKLKLDMSRMPDTEAPPSVNSETGEEGKSGPSSALEFVTSPDDDTINKLTSQLELVEKQRRQVIVDNEKLTWQKESLEHIVDATSKERDDLKEKLKKVELQLSTKETEHITEVDNYKYTIQDLENKLHKISISTEEIQIHEFSNQQLENKLSTLHGELQMAQLKILDLESIKLEYTRLKSSSEETIKLYKEQLQDAQRRLKEISTTVFQPLRFSVMAEPETASSEYTSYLNNVKVYDRTLKYLADLLNKLSHALSDSLVQTHGVVASLYDFKLDKSTVEQFKSGLANVKRQLERQHADAISNIGQVKSTMTIFEGIFKDHNELLKKIVSQEPQKPQSPVNIEALTSALVARGQELNMLEAELKKMKIEKEEKDLLKAQLDLYKSDFEAEREAREKMASEKENLLTDLRQTQRHNQELTKQLEEVRKMNPGVYRSVTTKRPQSSASSTPSRQPSSPSNASNTTGNIVYKCPKCMRFSCEQYSVMEDHLDYCLDDF